MKSETTLSAMGFAFGVMRKLISTMVKRRSPGHAFTSALIIVIIRPPLRNLGVLDGLSKFKITESQADGDAQTIADRLCSAISSSPCRLRR